MELSTPPAATLDSDYIESHGAEAGCPERELWRATLRLAGEDLFSAHETIRRNAVDFFMGNDLPLIMALAGLDRDDVPRFRSKVLELAEASPDTPQPKGKLISHQGETRTMSEWSRITGISVPTMSHRLRRNWSIERTLTTPGQKAGGRGLQ